MSKIAAAVASVENENQFENKLKRVALAIVKDAGPRRCGECAHALLTSGGVGHCTKYDNYDGATLRIYRADAYACHKGFRLRNLSD